MGARTHGVSGFAPNQLTFSFIPPEDRQHMADLWKTHFSRAEVRAQRQLDADRKRIMLKVIDSQTLEIDWQKCKPILDLPLWSHQASDLDVQPAEEDITECTVPSAISSSNPEEERGAELTFEQIEVYHAKVLEYSLNVLKSRGNAEEKYEILQWIWAHDIYCWVAREVAGVIKQVPIYRKQLPFTFQMCCACEGLDYERMRDGLAHIFRPVLQQLGMESLIN